MSEKVKLKQIKVNFYPYQHEQIKNLAVEKKVTIAQFIREKLELTLDEKDTRKIYTETQKKVYKSSDPKLLFELNKIGNNLNQIAKVINQKKDDINSIDILQSLVNIEQQIKTLK